MRATLRHRKARGELAEMQFMLMAALCGLIVCKPWGDCQPFDYIVYCKGSRRSYRVQVKSCTQRIVSPRRSSKRGPKPASRRGSKGSGWAVSTKRSLGRAYSARHTDFVVAYLMQEDAWYVIPIKALAGRKSIYLYPRNPQSRGMFAKYRDAWQL